MELNSAFGFTFPQPEFGGVMNIKMFSTEHFNALCLDAQSEILALPLKGVQLKSEDMMSGGGSSYIAKNGETRYTGRSPQNYELTTVDSISFGDEPSSYDDFFIISRGHISVGYHRTCSWTNLLYVNKVEADAIINKYANLQTLQEEAYYKELGALAQDPVWVWEQYLEYEQSVIYECCPTSKWSEDIYSYRHKSQCETYMAEGGKIVFVCKFAYDYDRDRIYYKYIGTCDKQEAEYLNELQNKICEGISKYWSFVSEDEATDEAIQIGEWWLSPPKPRKTGGSKKF